MPFLTIVWDLDDDSSGNVQHCLKHDVTMEAVEAVLQIPMDIDHSDSSGRPVAFDNTKTGRHLIVVYEEIDDETVYPITAYDVTPRNRR